MPAGTADSSRRASAGDAGAPQWRYWLGLALVILSLILPILALILLPILGFPPDVNAVVLGLSVAGGPDLLLVAAAAVMGKENLERLTAKLGPWFRRLLRWDSVTRRRYTIGLWVLTISFLLPFAIALFFDGSVVDANGDPGWGYYVMIASTIAFILAFLSMGAPLWERVRAVFTWEARISFPESDA
jgi:hypothetical protein